MTENAPSALEIESVLKDCAKIEEDDWYKWIQSMQIGSRLLNDQSYKITDEMETIEMAAAKIKCVKFDIFSGTYVPPHILDYQVVDDNEYKSCNTMKFR